MRARKKVKQRERHRKGKPGEGKHEKVADRVELAQGGNKSHLFFLLVFFLLFFYCFVHEALFERERERETERKGKERKTEEEAFGPALRRGIALG